MESTTVAKRSYSLLCNAERDFGVDLKVPKLDTNRAANFQVQNASMNPTHKHVDSSEISSEISEFSSCFYEEEEEEEEDGKKWRVPNDNEEWCIAKDDEWYVPKDDEEWCAPTDDEVWCEPFHGSSEISHVNIAKLSANINSLMSIHPTYVLTSLIEMRREYFWEKYSLIYSKDDQVIAGYDYDAETNKYVDIYRPKTWGKFFSVISQYLDPEDQEYVELLMDGGESSFSTLLENFHGRNDKYSLAKAIKRLTEDQDKQKYSEMFFRHFNETVDSVLGNFTSST